MRGRRELQADPAAADREDRGPRAVTGPGSVVRASALLQNLEGVHMTFSNTPSVMVSIVGFTRSKRHPCIFRVACLAVQLSNLLKVYTTLYTLTMCEIALSPILPDCLIWRCEVLLRLRRRQPAFRLVRRAQFGKWRAVLRKRQDRCIAVRGAEVAVNGRPSEFRTAPFSSAQSK